MSREEVNEILQDAGDDSVDHKVVDAAYDIVIESLAPFHELDYLYKKLQAENEELKIQLSTCQRHRIEDASESLSDFNWKMTELKKKNEELEEIVINQNCSKCINYGIVNKIKDDA